MRRTGLALVLLALVASLPSVAPAAKAKPAAKPAQATPAPAVDTACYLLITGHFGDRDSYARFADAFGAARKRYGAKLLAVGGGPKISPLEGSWDDRSLVVLSVASVPQAKAMWGDPDIVRAVAYLRAGGPLNVVMIEGQPPAGGSQPLDD